MYPLFFEPVYKKIIWGGNNLERVFGRRLPDGNIAESWEVCCHKHGASNIINGEYNGKSLEDIIRTNKIDILGTKCSQMNTFPILIKIIDANDKLSVQVHPDDEYALRIENEPGKTEMWYIIEARENAQIIYGTKAHVTKEAFRNAILDGSLEKYLNYMPVKKGDAVLIPSGTVHAILDGIMVAEIQQNSDTTYRVYDWNRRDLNGNSRQLHIEKALDVIDLNFKPNNEALDIIYDKGWEIRPLARCDYFNVDELKVSEKYKDFSNGETFIAYTSISGRGKLMQGNDEWDIIPGTSFLIPASMGDYEIAGNVSLLKSYM